MDPKTGKIVEAEMISRPLGHRNLDVTRRYIDMDQEVLDEATENYATIAGKLL